MLDGGRQVAARWVTEAFGCAVHVRANGCPELNGRGLAAQARDLEFDS